MGAQCCTVARLYIADKYMHAMQFQARLNNFSTGGRSSSKIKFYYVTYDTLTFTPSLEIVLIVNAI